MLILFLFNVNYFNIKNKCVFEILLIGHNILVFQTSLFYVWFYAFAVSVFNNSSYILCFFRTF